MPQQVYLNGQLVDADSAQISPLANGFLYGVGLFETLRAYRGRYLFRLEAHLERLFTSAAVLGMEVGHTASDLTAAINKTLITNALTQDAYVRLTVAQGIENSPIVLITAKPLLPYPEMLYLHGARATLTEIRRNPTSPLARIKSLNYLENLLMRKGTRARGADEALFLDTDGNLAEGAACNLFWVKSGMIYTPCLDCPILPGITRSVVIEIARQEGYKVKEGKWGIEKLLEADEAFLTNSLMEVMPLTVIDETSIGSGRPGEITTQRIRLDRRSVEAWCGEYQK